MRIDFGEFGRIVRFGRYRFNIWISKGSDIGRARSMRHAWSKTDARRRKMSVGMILLFVVLIALMGTMSTWGYSKN
jgi:hypothetical protein